MKKWNILKITLILEDQEVNTVTQVDGMYESWFLDYASYVILERAVPDIHDGLKPVQRRILHSLKEMDDGRYNKVANVIGNTMKYHPHGDASIGDALVNMGQKDLLIDMQGNWGNILTGDRAAALVTSNLDYLSSLLKLSLIQRSQSGHLLTMVVLKNQ